MDIFKTYFNEVPISYDSNNLNDSILNSWLNRKEISTFINTCKQRVFIKTEILNYERNLNRFLAKINNNIEVGEYFFGSFETFQAREQKKFIEKIPFIRFFFRFFDFFLHRVSPKIYVLRTIYFWIFRKPNRLFSKAEILGRMIYNGFEIQKVENHFNLSFFLVKKVTEPIRDKKVNYGFIFKMARIGKNGKIIQVYKIRTMHPYSEYLQDYMLKELGFAENGKISRDFRITPWGYVLRKYWLDELPQLLNVLKGEMKLVGIRPVSVSYFNTLPIKIQEMRKKHKPGCIPPYLAFDKKTNLKNIIISEFVYMKKKQKNPYFTDIYFCFMALKNILFNFKRGA